MRSRVATETLLQAAFEEGIEVVLIQEPYVGRTGVMAQRPGIRIVQCSLNRSKPVNAAVVVLGDTLRVIHDPQMVTETEAAVRLGVLSIYCEGDRDVDETLAAVARNMRALGTDNILGGDLNAWSFAWGSREEDSRGRACSSFFDQEGLHVLNQGDTPTFEVMRRGKLCTSLRKGFS